MDCLSITIEDSNWVRDNLRCALDTSRKHILKSRAAVGKLPVSHAQAMKNTKKLETTSTVSAVEPFASSLMSTFNDAGLELSQSLRLTTFVSVFCSIHWRTTLNPSTLKHETEVEDGKWREAGIRAWTAVVGDDAFFRSMGREHGPIGCVLEWHAKQYGLEDPLRCGPLPKRAREEPFEWRAAHARTLEYWYACKHPPRLGWFSSWRGQISAKPDAPPVAPGPSYWKYVETYPWSDWVNRADFAVYLFARMILIAAREVNQAGRSDGVDVLNAALSILPAPPIVVLHQTRAPTATRGDP